MTINGIFNVTAHKNNFFFVPHFKSWQSTVFALRVYTHKWAHASRHATEKQSVFCRYYPKWEVKSSQEFFNTWVWQHWYLYHHTSKSGDAQNESRSASYREALNGSWSCELWEPGRPSSSAAIRGHEWRLNKNSQPDSGILPKGFKLQLFHSRNNFAASVTAISTGTEQWGKKILW